ncbi:MAG: PorV/PorQ family protein [Candidatus Krumholzibacteriia bacterium]
MHIPRLVGRVIRPLGSVRFVATAVSALAACALLLGTAAPVGATKYAGAFMEDGGGARALGLARAFTAVADDPSATFWNPAGLAGVRSRQLLLMHAERFGDLVDRDFASYVQPVGWRILGGDAAGIGFTVIRLGIDDIPFTDHLRDQLDADGDGIVSREETLGLLDLQDQIIYESDQEFAFLLSYGERKGEWLFGASLKFIRQSVGPYSSFGIGADLALLRPKVWGNLDFGLKLQDVTTTYLSWNTEDGTTEYILPAVVPGLAYRLPLPEWNMGLLLAASVETRFENRGEADQFSTGDISANAHVGAEVSFSERVFLRGGFDSGWKTENITAGAGFRISPLTVDYAYAGDVLDIDEVTHRISLSVMF